jgi:hypothetical protein
LDAENSCIIGVAFTPSSPGSKTGTLIINDDVTDGSQKVKLSGTAIPVQLISIFVAPPNSSTPLGTVAYLLALGNYNDGSSQNLTQSVIWTSSSLSVATIDSAGRVTSLSQGSTTITASLGTVSGSTTFTVTAPVLNLITITPANSTIALAEPIQFIATGRFSDGSTQNLTNFATWTSSDSAIAAVTNSTGLVQGGQVAGRVTISASSGIVSGSTSLFVKSDFNLTGSMSVPRQSHTSTLLNTGQVLIAGGGNTSGLLLGAELYDPVAGVFAPTGNMTQGRGGSSATLLNDGRVLISGGNIGSVGTAEVYDPAAGIFTATGNLNSVRGGHSAILLNDGRVLLIGGADRFGTELSSAEIYDPATGSFTPTGSMSTPRFGRTATLLNDGTVLVAGGTINGTVFASAEIYNPSTGSFTPTSAMSIPRDQHSAVRLLSGKVLIGGGFTSQFFTTSFDLYDPVSAVFVPTGSSFTRRLQGTCTLLSTGKVLFTGGTGFANLNDAEVYDPDGGTFAPLASSLTSIRLRHAATLLNDGRVLITGGFDGQNVLGTAEIYQPVP